MLILSRNSVRFSVDIIIQKYHRLKTERARKTKVQTDRRTIRSNVVKTGRTVKGSGSIPRSELGEINGSAARKLSQALITIFTRRGVQLLLLCLLITAINKYHEAIMKLHGPPEAMLAHISYKHVALSWVMGLG